MLCFRQEESAADPSNSNLNYSITESPVNNFVGSVGNIFSSLKVQDEVLVFFFFDEITFLRGHESLGEFQRSHLQYVSSLHFLRDLKSQVDDIAK